MSEWLNREMVEVRRRCMKKVMKKSVVLFCLVAGGVFAAEK